MAEMVYIADDNAGDRFFLREALEEIEPGISLSESQSAEELLEKLKGSAAAPKVIFLDLFMPRRDGVSCLKEIRSNRKFDSTHVVVFSSSAAYAVVEEAYRQGAAMYIRKGISFKNTLDVLKDVLKGIRSNKFKRSKETFYIT